MKIRGTTITTPIARSAVSDDTRVSGAPWSSKNTVDKLCPDINESGRIVACEPVAGYPLTVQTDGATKVYRSGKNLIAPFAGTRVSAGVTFKGNGDGNITFTGMPTAQWTASLYLMVPPEILKDGKTYSVTPERASGYRIYFRYKDAEGNWKHTQTTSRNHITWDDSWSLLEIQIYCPDIKEYNETVWLQLELGEVATEYEPYRAPDEFTPGEAIPALNGVNTIWADSGDVTVTGKADPVAVSRKQDERIKALEASLTALLEG